MSPLARSLVSLLIGALCAPALVMHVTMLLGLLQNLPDALHEFPHATLRDWGAGLLSCLFAASVLAWPILAWMTIGWIRNVPVHRAWVWVGTFLAVAWMLPVPKFLIFAVFVLPGIVFAVYLCLWHRYPRVRDPFGGEDGPAPPVV